MLNIYIVNYSLLILYNNTTENCSISCIQEIKQQCNSLSQNFVQIFVIPSFFGFFHAIFKVEPGLLASNFLCRTDGWMDRPSPYEIEFINIPYFRNIINAAPNCRPRNFKIIVYLSRPSYFLCFTSVKIIFFYYTYYLYVFLNLCL